MLDDCKKVYDHNLMAAINIVMAWFDRLEGEKVDDLVISLPHDEFASGSA